MLHGVMTRLSFHVNDKKHFAEIQETDKEVKTKAKEEYANVIKGLKYVKKNKNVREILESACDTLYSPDFEDDLEVFLQRFLADELVERLRAQRAIRLFFGGRRDGVQEFIRH